MISLWDLLAASWYEERRGAKSITLPSHLVASVEMGHALRRLLWNMWCASG